MTRRIRDRDKRTGPSPKKLALYWGVGGFMAAMGVVLLVRGRWTGGLIIAIVVVRVLVLFLSGR